MSKENGTSYSIGNQIVEFEEFTILSGKDYSVINTLGFGWTTTGYVKIKTTITVSNGGSFSKKSTGFVEFSCEGQLADVIVDRSTINCLISCRIAEENLQDLFDEADASLKS